MQEPQLALDLDPPTSLMAKPEKKESRLIMKILTGIEAGKSMFPQLTASK